MNKNTGIQTITFKQ